ncbi:hypothetical protein GCM10010512_40720 [Streptomyces thermoviolaceus subsp. thermoviolaceus]|nr:hypothetical protein GCM10010499_18330 [Streptomyces thermoviolaceus subsp. apingens]GHB05065.1 hypothetical protein GCM10010512_40720 [Streptomyces thermoviolaceus subsp. thermoviolaceus]
MRLWIADDPGMRRSSALVKTVTEGRTTERGRPNRETDHTIMCCCVDKGVQRPHEQG